jgi:adenylosuccinate synthase
VVARVSGQSGRFTDGRRRTGASIEELVGVPIVLVGVGAGREETITRLNPFGE